MACRDGMCGGCESCYPEPEYHDGFELAREELTENARHALVAAANDLVKRGSVTAKEMAALEALLDVFDPQEEMQEDAEVAF